MKHQPFSLIFVVSIICLSVSLLGATTGFAKPNVPQEVLDAIAEQGTARIIVELDVPWTAEGFLSDSAVAKQRAQIADAQTEFVETLNQNSNSRSKFWSFNFSWSFDFSVISLKNRTTTKIQTYCIDDWVKCITGNCCNQDLADDDIIDDAAASNDTLTISAETTFQTVPYFVMVVNSQTLLDVQQNALTSTIVLDRPDDPSLQQSFPLTGADKAWEQEYSGSGQAIAVVDTGVDKTHSLFSPNRVIAEACFSTTLCPNMEPTQQGEGAAIPCDFDNCDHGTHIAGIAASVAKEASIIAVQVFSDLAGNARSFRSDQISALEWLHLNRDSFDTPLAAINMSIEDKKQHNISCNNDARAKIIQNLHSVGIVTIAPSGNQGYTNGISAPACISEVISVGATDKSGNLWNQTNWSDLLDLLAPGVGIESALPGGLTGVKDGTSMAAPHVAGAWAILKAANTDASSEQILAQLTEIGPSIDGKPLVQVEATLPKPDCTIIEAGLVAHYPFDETPKDITGNGNDGTESNVSYVTGQCGKALQLTGNTKNNANSLVMIGDRLDAMDYSFSISARIKAADFNQNQALIVAKGMTGNLPGYAISYASGKLSFILTDDNSKSLKASIPIAQLPTNEFMLVTGTLERDSFFSTLRIYLNGELVLVSRGDIGAVNTNSPLVIGATAQNTMGFNGVIDEVLFYNRALSEQEVKTLYNPEAPAVPKQFTKYSLKVNKIGDGRGRVLTKQTTETDWSLRCLSDCQQESIDYTFNSNVILTAYPDKGFVFGGWSGNCSGVNSQITVTMDAAKTCTARFNLEPNQVMHSLTINKVGNGTVKSNYTAGIDCGNLCIAYYPPNQFVNLEAVFDNKDTVFIGWTGDCDGKNPKLRVAMEAAKTCTATFQTYNLAEQFALTVNKSNPQGIVLGKINGENTTLSCQAGCTEANYHYTSGSQVVLTATAPTGFTFTGWIGDCSGTEKHITVLMDSAKNCSAAFDLDDTVNMHKLRITLIGTGTGRITQGNLIDCGDVCSAYYLTDQTVWLGVKTAPLSAFLGWGGDCDSNKVTITKDMNCTAHFQNELEQIAEEMAETFCVGAQLENNAPISSQYPCTAENKARLKEAFWFNAPTLIQTEQYLASSTANIWPNQFEGVEWLPPDVSAEHTQSIQIMDEFVGIRLNLLNNEGIEEEVGLVIYYSDEQPEMDGGGERAMGAVWPLAFFSRWAFRRWWW